LSLCIVKEIQTLKNKRALIPFELTPF